MQRPFCSAGRRRLGRLLCLMATLGPISCGWDAAGLNVFQWNGASCVAAAEPSAQPYVLGSRSFTIPFTVDASTAEAAEVELLVAAVQPRVNDQWNSGPVAMGKANQPSDLRWMAAAVASTKRPEPFSYTAAKDGEYWFTTRTRRAGEPAVSKSGMTPDVTRGGVLKVLIDTTPPRIELVTDADGDGKIRADVVIQDATEIVDIDVRYVTDTDKEEWKIVAYHPSGSLQFHPEGQWFEAAVVVTALDAAGNKNSVREFVRRPRIAEVPVQRFASRPSRGYDARPAPYRAGVTPSTLPSSPRNDLSAVNKPGETDTAIADRVDDRFDGRFAQPMRTAATRTDSILPPPATPEQIGLGYAEPDLGPRQTTVEPLNAPEVVGSGLPTPSRPPEIPLSAPGSPSDPPAGSPTDSPPQPERRERPRSVAEAIKPIDAPSAVPTRREEAEADPGADTAAGSRTEDPGPSAVGIRTDAKATTPEIRRRLTIDDRTELSDLMQRIPVRYSDSHRFSLDYEVESLDGRGVEAIELYGTVDYGRRWSLWGRDADRETPFDIEVRDDGEFGFRIVVVGRSGLASPRPLDGEEPDLMVVVDRETPRVRITGAKYGEGDEVGSLVVQWECTDVNLKPRPITLAFSENIDGPWTTIAGGLPDNGRYAWPADPNLPRAFFLRIDATDRSGNVGTHVLDQPIDAQGLAPRAKIRGFRSL